MSPPAAETPTMCWICDDMAPTCAGCDPEVFEDLCYFPDPRRRKTYRPTSLEEQQVLLGLRAARKAKPKPKEAPASAPPVRLVVVKPGTTPAKSRTHPPTVHYHPVDPS